MKTLLEIHREEQREAIIREFGQNMRNLSADHMRRMAGIRRQARAMLWIVWVAAGLTILLPLIAWLVRR